MLPALGLTTCLGESRRQLVDGSWRDYDGPLWPTATRYSDERDDGDVTRMKPTVGTPSRLAETHGGIIPAVVIFGSV